ncbi:OmpA family protein [Oceaniovalibus guishaninsula JLT2003]|uniref:OmpA family protein n=1 Tax=Oceaniovalibus guishaninsula JLT2003 TaxID=1231392 RepID=K2HA70_9RHOB|nr:OmpA family protein [Oceaniovalibus guishaninsula]EKE44428.1 OmpA family protein [Oceaniovalibus guishaninsula JLT2003]
MPKTAALALLALLAGCGPDWTRPAGGDLDEGRFGNPTMTNMLVQSGRLGQVEGLNNRFSREVDSVVTFDFNSAVLTPIARATVAQQAQWIRQFPEVRFRVYGHTDLVGSATYNKRLGLQRARAVVAALVAQGVDPARLEALVSFGETQPLIVTQGRERANRRTVTEVSGFVGRNDQLLNGKYAELVFREYVASATELSPTAQATLGTLAE